MVRKTGNVSAKAESGHEWHARDCTYLRTAQCQDETIVGRFFGQVGKVRTFPLATVTSTNEENAANHTFLDRVNNFARHGQQDAMIKARRAVMRGFNGLRKALGVLGLFNHGRKVTIGSNVGNTRESDLLCGIGKWKILMCV